MVDSPGWVDPKISSIVWERIDNKRYFMGVELEEPDHIKAVGIVDVQELEYFKSKYPSRDIESKQE